MRCAIRREEGRGLGESEFIGLWERPLKPKCVCRALKTGNDRKMQEGTNPPSAIRVEPVPLYRHDHGAAAGGRPVIKLP